MSARSFWRLLGRRVGPEAAQILPCITSSSRATGNFTPSTSFWTEWGSQVAWIGLNLDTKTRFRCGHMDAVGEALHDEMLFQFFRYCVQMLGGNDHVEIEADDRLRVRIHGLTTNQAVAHTMRVKQVYEAFEKTFTIHGHGLPKRQWLHIRFPLTR